MSDYAALIAASVAVPQARAQVTGPTTDSLAPAVVPGAFFRVAYVLHEAALDRAMDAPRGAQGPSWYELPPAVLQLRPVRGAWRIVGGPGLLNGAMSTLSVSVDCAETTRPPAAPPPA